MVEFTQDKIFKNVSDEDAKILLEILGIKSDTVKLWTKELRLLDPKDYRPDIIVELDDENRIIELMSKKVGEEFSARGLTYVAVANRDEENGKQVGLMVLSTAEQSKTIRYQYNDKNVFIYDVIALSDLDVGEIINNVEPKILTNEKIRGYDLVLYALLSLIDAKNMQDNIHRVVNNLLELKNASISLKALSYGIEWMIVDKYVDDGELRNIFCDALGDKMSLIHEYGERKERRGVAKGMRKGMINVRKQGRREAIEIVVRNLLNSGMSCREISQRINMPLDEIREIQKGM